jgi:hypothetical protein
MKSLRTEDISGVSGASSAPSSNLAQGLGQRSRQEAEDHLGDSATATRCVGPLHEPHVMSRHGQQAKRVGMDAEDLWSRPQSSGHHLPLWARHDLTIRPPVCASAWEAVYWSGQYAPDLVALSIYPYFGVR